MNKIEQRLSRLTVSARKIENLRKIQEYLNNPANEWLARARLSVDVLGYQQKATIYKHFTPDELTDIESAAIEERKRRSAGGRAAVYDALLKKPKEGDVAAMKEFLDRTEGKVVAKVEANVNGELALVIAVKELLSRSDGQSWGLPEKQ